MLTKLSRKIYTREKSRKIFSNCDNEIQCLAEEEDENQTLTTKEVYQFPLDFFPEKYQKALKEISESINTPIVFPAAALLSLIGTSIGRTHGISVKESWVVFPNQYMAVIGRSGIGKTPGVNAIFKHIREIETEWYNQRELEGINLRQLIVDETTLEGLSCVLEGNPRGILWHRDELAGLFKELDKYNGQKGCSLPRILSAYDAGLWKINRADSTRNKYIPHTMLSIFGTIQPRVLSDIFKEKDIDSGLIPRFLFSFVE